MIEYWDTPPRGGAEQNDDTDPDTADYVELLKVILLIVAIIWIALSLYEKINQGLNCMRWVGVWC